MYKETEFKKIKKNTIIYKWNTFKGVKKYEVLQKTDKYLYVFNNKNLYRIDDSIYETFYTDNHTLSITKNIDVSFYQRIAPTNSEKLITGKFKDVLIKNVKILKPKFKNKFNNRK